MSTVYYFKNYKEDEVKNVIAFLRRPRRVLKKEDQMRLAMNLLGTIIKLRQLGVLWHEVEAVEEGGKE